MFKALLIKHRTLILALMINNVLLTTILFFVMQSIIIKPLPEVEFADTRIFNVAGNYPDRGTIRLYDRTKEDAGAPVKLSPLEIGFYRYGAGLFTDNMFEFWTGKHLSIANHLRTPNLEIRTKKDLGAGLWFNGAGELGTSLDKMKIFVGGGNGDINDSLTTERTVNYDYQYIFGKDGTFEIKGDIILNGKSLNQHLTCIPKCNTLAKPSG